MKEIFLTKGMVAIVDDDDYNQLSKYKWQAEFRADRWYARRRKPNSEGGKCIYMHREIMNPNQDEVVDHINGNGLDNRRENIRTCTRKQNQWNTKRQKNNRSSQFVGVHFDKSRNKFVASIGYNYRVIYCGRYDTEIEAAIAFNKKAIEIKGEFAHLNIIP